MRFIMIGGRRGLGPAAKGQGWVFKLMPHGGTWTVKNLYSFQGGTDGAQPYSPIFRDTAGNLFGTTYFGGGSTKCHLGCGTVFKLVPSGLGTWTESLPYILVRSNGQYPFAGLVSDGAGHLYGTTTIGGLHNFGAVFELTP
jgi:uncharacterized repeat protein (TIGR03803 family)